MKLKHKYIHAIIFFVFGLVCLFLSSSRHSKTGFFNYESEIWADKGGYYVYLPALFTYQFNPHNFPDSIDFQTGEGFVLDYENSRVRTKYSYGTALLQLPFFLVANLVAEATHQTPKGFTPVHHKMVNVAAIFYLLAGMLFLWKYLRKYYTPLTVYISLFVIFAGTNLFYYAIDETGMSHIYSFAAISGLLLFLQRKEYLAKKRPIDAFVLGLIGGLIIILRPTNAIIFSAFLFLDITKWAEVGQRIKRIFTIRTMLPALAGLIFPIVPQLIYYKFTYGSWLHYSYGEEGFNWGSPMLLHTWFSTMNGLFTYTPMFILILVSLIMMVRNKPFISAYLLILFFGVSYMLSCWWVWHFGCSFGARNFVELLPLFSIPIAFLMHRLRNKALGYKIALAAIVLIFIVHNLKLSYAYTECFFGGFWDFKTYFSLLFS